MREDIPRRIDGKNAMQIQIVKSWNGYLECFAEEQKDVYFLEEYAKLAAGEKDTPLCAVCEEGEKILLMPFLRRFHADYLDFETPYGYGGPISNIDDPNWNKHAIKELFSYFSSHNYLAGFIRFHPLLNNADLCRTIFDVIDDRKTVVIDTSLPEIEIWQNFAPSSRRQIRKAERNGLVFERDDEFRYMEEFKRLYTTTMLHHKVDDFYFFGDDYYRQFIVSFRGKGFIGCVKKGQEIISAALFLHENKRGHYHLGGSNREYISLGTNNFLFWNVAREMKKEGVELFHLGGGTDGDEENSLLKFKKTLSPITKQFSIGRMIFQKQDYDSICIDWAERNPDKAERYKNFLLKYRY